MEVLLISGEQDSGKSTLIHSIADWLKQQGYSSKENQKERFRYDKSINVYDDIQTFFEKEDVLVYVHSATDDLARIDELKKVIEKLKKLIDEGNGKRIVLITSARNYGDGMRDELCKAMGWTNSNNVLDNGKPIVEIPLVKIKHVCGSDELEKVKKWYHTNLFLIVETYLERIYGL